MSTQVLRVRIPAPAAAVQEREDGLVLAVHQSPGLALVVLQDARPTPAGCGAEQALETLVAWIRGRCPAFPVSAADVVVRDVDGRYAQVLLEWALDDPRIPPLATWKPLAAAGCMPGTLDAFEARYGRIGLQVLSTIGIR